MEPITGYMPGGEATYVMRSAMRRRTFGLLSEPKSAVELLRRVPWCTRVQVLFPTPGLPSCSQGACCLASVVLTRCAWSVSSFIGKLSGDCAWTPCLCGHVQ